MDVGIKGQLLQYLRQLKPSSTEKNDCKNDQMVCKIKKFTQLCQIPESSACLLHPVFPE